MPQAPYTLEQTEDDVSTLRGQMAVLSEIGTALNTGIPGTAGAQFPGITVTAASLQTIASATVPAGNATAGAVYELEVTGRGTWSSSGQTLEFACVFGGQTMRTCNLGAGYMAVSLPFSWKCWVRVICASAGGSGSWASEVGGFCSVNNTTLLTSGILSGAASANPTNSFFNADITAPFTVDTTVDEVLALQCAWGGTGGSPTLTSGVALFNRRK